MHPSRRAEIAHLKVDEAFFKLPSEYANFADVFSPKLATELPEYIRINDHAIELINNRQPPYGPIYNLGPIKLKTLKAYIENNLANGFIKPFKSLVEALIRFNKKPNGSLR